MPNISTTSTGTEIDVVIYAQKESRHEALEAEPRFYWRHFQKKMHRSIFWYLVMETPLDDLIWSYWKSKSWRTDIRNDLDLNCPPTVPRSSSAPRVDMNNTRRRVTCPRVWSSTFHWNSWRHLTSVLISGCECHRRFMFNWSGTRLQTRADGVSRTKITGRRHRPSLQSRHQGHLSLSTLDRGECLIWLTHIQTTLTFSSRC